MGETYHGHAQESRVNIECGFAPDLRIRCIPALHVCIRAGLETPSCTTGSSNQLQHAPVLSRCNCGSSVGGSEGGLSFRSLAVMVLLITLKYVRPSRRVASRWRFARKPAWSQGLKVASSVQAFDQPKLVSWIDLLSPPQINACSSDARFSRRGGWSVTFLSMKTGRCWFITDIRRK